MLSIIIFCIISYCIGSISSAILVSAFLHLPDPRTQGSKNPGTTNVLRLGGKKAAILTLLGDVLKGFIPVWIAGQMALTEPEVGAVMLAVVLGHLYPIFFKFQGGKGVATALGAVLGFSWPVGLLFLATWGIVVALFRISSAGALATAFLAPFYVYIICNTTLAIAMVGVSGLLFWRHRTNIQRLMSGTEPKIGSRR
jgi:glycerol-3-phosphate acyltransferase PlsY